jgi:4-hydroxy-tetrahydrodipicolinate reductase
MKYGLIGFKGRMGKEIMHVFDNNELVLKMDNDFYEETAVPEVIIDFSSPDVTDKVIELAKEKNAGLVIGTTGLSDHKISELRKLSEEIPVVQSFNFSQGINILKMILRDYSKFLKDWDCEIVEIHHNQKKDSPSGTALLLRDEIKKEEIVSHSLRMGGIPGDHRVLFANEGEMLEFKHRAVSRKVFALGALKAAEFLLEKKKGFFSFEEVIKWTH